MIQLNPFAISNLLVILFYFPITLLILIKGKTKLTKIFALYFFSAGIWGLGGFLGVTTSDERLAKAYLIFAYCGVLFIPVFFQHATSLIINKERKFLYFFTYGQAIYFCFLNLSGKLFTTKWAFNSFYYYNGGIAFFVSFIIWLLILFYTAFQLIIFYKENYSDNKKDTLFVLFGLLSYFGGINNYLPVFDIAIYPYGNFLVPIHSILITYAILRHHILDIDIAIKKGIVYYTLIALISVIYLIIVITTEKLLQSYLGYNSISITIFAAFIIGIIFIPLKNRIQYFVDKIFFQKSPVEIEEENKRLRHEIIQSDKLKTISTLASGMAHEIKNPLTAIKTFSEYLPYKLNDKKFLSQFSKIVGKEVDRIDSLVNELLEFAKPSPPALKRTEIHKLLKEVLDLLSNNFVCTKINILTDFEKSVTYLNIDPKQIRQALLNVLLNAIEAMPKGGTLTVKTRIKGLKDYSAKGETLNPSNPEPFNPTPSNPIPSVFEISITDTGCGISQEDLNHIFDPFFTKKDQGTGLGLSITHGIIQEHGGKIIVESKVGKGTKVVMGIPLIQINTD